MSASNQASLDQSVGDLDIPDSDDDQGGDDDDFPTYVEKAQVSQITANRILTTNFFISVFGPGIKVLASTNIAHQEKDFGSGVSIYEVVNRTDCNTTRSPLSPCTGIVTDNQTFPNIGLNIRREAFRIRTCHWAVKSNANLLFALKRIQSNATLAKPPVINEQNLDKAYQLFFRAKPLPDAETMDALTIVTQHSTVPVEKWRDLLLTLCLSPHWQVL